MKVKEVCEEGLEIEGSKMGKKRESIMSLMDSLHIDSIYKAGNKLG